MTAIDSITIVLRFLHFSSYLKPLTRSIERVVVRRTVEEQGNPRLFVDWYGVELDFGAMTWVKKSLKISFCFFFGMV